MYNIKIRIHTVRQMEMWNIFGPMHDYSTLSSTNKSMSLLTSHHDSTNTVMKREIQENLLFTNQTPNDSPALYLQKLYSPAKLDEIRRRLADSPSDFGTPCANGMHTCAGGATCGNQVLIIIAIST